MASRLTVVCLFVLVCLAELFRGVVTITGDEGLTTNTSLPSYAQPPHKPRDLHIATKLLPHKGFWRQMHMGTNAHE
jgi:hypothetical protein